MRKVNIQSRKQPWVSHSHWDSKAFNRNTHSLFLINTARASMCADLNSVFSIPSKPARHPSHRLQTGLAVGLGSFYLVLAIGLALVLCKELLLLFFVVYNLICLLVCLCRFNRIAWAGYLRNNRNMFLSSLESGKSKT